MTLLKILFYIIVISLAIYGLTLMGGMIALILRFIFAPFVFIMKLIVKFIDFIVTTLKKEHSKNPKIIYVNMPEERKMTEERELALYKLLDESEHYQTLNKDGLKIFMKECNNILEKERNSFDYLKSEV